MASDLASRNEVMLLAHELGAPESSLDFLVGDTASELRSLRQALTAALFTRQESRFQRLAALAKLLPATATGKIAEFALGPTVSGRVAGVLEPKDAVKLAKALRPDFLAKLTPSLDPQRVAGIVGLLPHDLTTTVGRLLVAERAHLVLGRFVAVAPIPVVVAVIGDAAPEEVLQVAMFCEDKSALQPVVDHLDDQLLSGVVEVAAGGDTLDDALTLLEFLDPPTCGRLVSFAADLPEHTRDRLLERVSQLGAWDVVARAFAHMGGPQVAAMTNLDGVRAEGVIDEFIVAAHRQNQPLAVVHAILAWDAETLVAAKSSTQLSLVGIREWILGSATTRAGALEAILDSI